METLAPLRCCAYNSIKSLTLAMEILSQRTLPTPLELISEQSGADRWFLPTGSLIVQQGYPVRAIFAVERHCTGSLPLPWHRKGAPRRLIRPIPTAIRANAHQWD